MSLISRVSNSLFLAYNNIIQIVSVPNSKNGGSFNEIALFTKITLRDVVIIYLSLVLSIPGQLALITIYYNSSNSFILKFTRYLNRRTAATGK